MTTAITILTAIIAALPKLIDAWKKAKAAGKDPGSVNLAEFLSTDALQAIDEAINEAQTFLDKFED